MTFVNNFIDHCNKQYLGYLREAHAYGLSNLKRGRKHKQNFLLYGSGRSGSTLLVELLNSSPHIFCDKEILNRPIYKPIDFIRNRSSLYNCDLYGFKLLSYQLSLIHKIHDEKAFLNTIVDDLNFKMIYISRRNLLRQTLSIHYAKFRNVWHQKKGDQILPKMNVDLKLLYKNLEELRAQKEHEERIIKNLQYLDINYEEDLLCEVDRRNAIKKMANYLSIQEFDPKISLKKIAPTQYSEYIENHQEMINYISKTKYSNYLDS